jgi:hypothetical protein
MKENIPLQPEEEILPIIGYEGLYSITSFGRVWSHLRYVKNKNGYRTVKAKFLKLKLDKDSYLCVTLCIEGNEKTYKVHRLVGIHYIENLDNSPEVNHKDGVKINNHKDNLEWCTKEENEYHAIKNNLKHKHTSKYYGVTFKKGLKNKPWFAQITVNKKYTHIGCFKTELEAARAYNEYVIKYGLNKPLNEF